MVIEWHCIDYRDYNSGNRYGYNGTGHRHSWTGKYMYFAAIRVHFFHTFVSSHEFSSTSTRS